MAYQYQKSRFRPRRPVRSFRDLEVYQKALEGAVMTAKHIYPPLAEIESKKGKAGYPLLDEMLRTSLEVPRMIAEAHSNRFEAKTLAFPLLDAAMADCNKMVVYLEQIRDIYGDRVEKVAVEELIRNYVYNRRKIFNLYKAWKKFFDQDKEEKKASSTPS